MRLPKAFRFDLTEVAIERRGDQVTLSLRRTPVLKTLADVARYLHEKYSQAAPVPDVPGSRQPQQRDLTW